MLPVPDLRARGTRGDHARTQPRARADLDRALQPGTRGADRSDAEDRVGRSRRGPERTLGNDRQPDAQRGAQPRLLAGRSRRRAARRQHPVRALLPGEAAVLPRGRRHLQQPDRRGLHTDRGRPVVGGEAVRKARTERPRRLRHPGHDHDPATSRRRGERARRPRPGQHQRRPALAARCRRQLVLWRPGHGPHRRGLPQRGGRCGWADPTRRCGLDRVPGARVVHRVPGSYRRHLRPAERQLLRCGLRGALPPPHPRLELVRRLRGLRAGVSGRLRLRAPGRLPPGFGGVRAPLVGR